MKYILPFIIMSISSLFSQNVEIIYEKRPPLIIEKDKTIEGFVATPLLKALKKSNIKYTLKEKPSKRHLYEIKANKKEICAIGWFKNSEREKFAKYTKALYQDKPMGIITRVDNHLVAKKKDIDSLLNEKNIKLLSKKSYSYGDLIDKKIIKFNVKKRNVSSDNITMLTLIAKKRADFMFISYEEATDILKTHPKKSQLKFLNLNGLPKGNKRYLICSFKTNNTTINKINKYLVENK